MSASLWRMVQFRHGISAFDGEVDGERISMFTSGRVAEPVIESEQAWLLIGLAAFAVGLVAGWLT